MFPMPLTANVAAVMFNFLLAAFFVLAIGGIALGVYAARVLKKAEDRNK